MVGCWTVEAREAPQFDEQVEPDDLGRLIFNEHAPEFHSSERYAISEGLLIQQCFLGCLDKIAATLCRSTRSKSNSLPNKLFVKLSVDRSPGAGCLGQEF